MTSSVLGFDTKTGQRVELHKSSRSQGLYIIGAPGTGKTGLIENLIIEDIKQDIGVCLIEPHGDLTQAVLSRIPDRRVKDVICLDVADYLYPFGLNLFTCAKPNNPVEVQKIVDQVRHIFDKLLGVSSDTPLILNYLVHCTYTLIANPGYTMADIYLLLTDKNCRQKLVANVKRPQTRLFWQQYEQMKLSEQTEQIASLQRRIDEFLQDLTLPIIGQSQSTINMRSVMDERKILLVKLSAEYPSVTSLIGSVIIALFLNAAYSRADLPIEKRKQFHIYADEFQRFATEDFAILFSEARKFGIALTVAHQFRDQLDKDNRAATLNVSNDVIFRVNSEDAQELKGQFDAAPLPKITGQQSMLTPTRKPVEHLLSRGHRNTNLNKYFVQQYLAPAQNLLDINHNKFIFRLREDIFKTPVLFFTDDEVVEVFNYLDTLFYEAMTRKSIAPVLSPRMFLLFSKVWDFYHLMEPYFTGLWEHPERSEKNWSELEILLVPDFRLHLDEAYHRFVFSSKRLHSSVEQRKEEFHKCFTFISALRTTLQILADEPILVDTGQYTPNYTQRTYVDMQGEIANELVKLPIHTAKIRITLDGKPVEHVMTTLNPKKEPRLTDIALQQRIAAIHAQNIQDGYLRVRQEVEEEIVNRQNCWDDELPVKAQRKKPI